MMKKSKIQEAPFMQKLLSYVRRAVDHYHMIEPGDRIAVGVSGGKDSPSSGTGK